MKTVLLSDTDLKLIREYILPHLELIPGSGSSTGSEDDEALWTLIEKLKAASS